MNKTRAEKFVRQRANELRSLARILFDAGLVRDVEPLQHAAGTCNLIRDGKDFHWRYDLHRLQFRPIDIGASRMRHSRPRTLQELSVMLHVSLEGECLDDGANGDPLRALVVELCLEGLTKDANLLTCAWHLDRHISNNSGDEDLDETVHFVHPHYHFQYGGREIWTKPDSEFGTHLLLESPRIAHPPLDAVLAVDFVLSNYFGREWGELRNTSGPYNELLRESQQRLWRPYATATSAYWDRPDAPEWDAQYIWPQLFDYRGNALRN